MRYKVQGGKLVREFIATDPTVIARLEMALKMRAQGGYVTFKGKPILINALHYLRVRGRVQVRVQYEQAVRPDTVETLRN